jgi:hypothetical protein
MQWLFGSLCLFSTLSSQEMPEDLLTGFSLPSSFAMKEIYKNGHIIIFRTDDAIFAQGRSGSKYSLKTPYGNTIATARLYELVPNHRPLLVIRDRGGHVLGFVRLENYRLLQLFKPVTGIVYDKNGVNILKAVFPLASKYCKISSVGEGKQLLAKTSKGKEGNFNVTFAENYQDFGIDPFLMASVLHVHSSKKLLTKLPNYIGIDEIDINDLAGYAQRTDGENQSKNVFCKGIDESLTEETTQLLRLQELLAYAPDVELSEEEKEVIVERLAQRFGTDEVSVESLQEQLPLLSIAEQAVLAEIIDSRL